MYLTIYSKDTRVIVGQIKTYNYVTYTDEFNGRGSFEIRIPTNEESLDLLVFGNYIHFEDNVVGIIKGVKNSEDSDVEITVYGYLTNHILEYRSFLVTHQYYDTIDEVVSGMFNDLFVNSGNKRKITFLAESITPVSYTSKIRVQNTGDTLFDVLVEMLAPYNIGFILDPSINMTASNGNVIENLTLKLIEPADRTINNPDDNDPVVFSFDLDNLNNLMYENDGRQYRNVAIVAGEGEGEERRIVEVGDVEASGINRIELYVDARDIQSGVSEEFVVDYVDEQFGELLDGEY